MEPISLASKAVGPIKATVQYFWRKWFPPKLGYRMAPSNLLEVICPYVYEGKVLEVLGQPHERHDERSAYRFVNALLQIDYEGESVKRVALVSLRLRWPNRFRVFPLAHKLGEATFADACERSGKREIELRTDFSSKFFCLWNERFYGYPGRYLYYSFALLSAATYPVIEMPAADYEAIDAGHIERGARLLTETAKFNAVMISRDEGENFSFDFTLFN
ncbi:hypothetical protein [Caballeronia sp. NCTM1]|uniref:hypothetical protein n=1 Tax=Caballeronia sp. NCTM1 TaxID=2921753 RepID=UPI002028B88E|nr:hypothetical protein [Caballeronia sp. NCTM1]